MSLTDDDKLRIKQRVDKALDCQFELYTWVDMLNDTLGDESERMWAMEHLTYGVVKK